jgi:hypothetical protein
MNKARVNQWIGHAILGREEASRLTGRRRPGT